MNDLRFKIMVYGNLFLSLCLSLLSSSGSLSLSLFTVYLFPLGVLVHALFTNSVFLGNLRERSSCE